jgi:hypothetical protein
MQCEVESGFCGNFDLLAFGQALNCRSSTAARRCANCRALSPSRNSANNRA